MNNTKHANTIDHDLHGLVGVRLVNPTAREAAVVDSRLEPLQTVLRREPNITIRFVKYLERCRYPFSAVVIVAKNFQVKSDVSKRATFNGLM